MGEIMGRMDEILQYLEGNGFLWPAVFICFAALLLFVWLLTRGARLWYWKVNLQTAALRNIDRTLQEIGEGIKENATISGRFEFSEEEIPAKDEIEIQSAELPEQPKGIYGVGKSGRVYTEEELEELIKD